MIFSYYNKMTIWSETESRNQLKGTKQRGAVLTGRRRYGNVTATSGYFNNGLFDFLSSLF